MKFKKQTIVEHEVTHVLLRLPIRYGTEDIPADFPLRKGDLWEAKIEIDTGRIIDWPAGKTGQFYQKQVDTGTYILIDAEGREVAALREEYVPNRLIPGEYGDYVELNINDAGRITNWPRHPDLDAFNGDSDNE